MGQIAALVLSAGVLFALPALSQASVIYTFDNISNNNATNAAAGEAQLFVTVADAGFNQVSFTFNNAGPAASSITDVYFDDGTLLGIASITDSGAGVEFAQNATPADLPSGNNAPGSPFVTTAGFSADSTAPAQPNVVNPGGEYVTILFDLISGQTYADPINALAYGLTNPGATGSLRIGIHVQGFANGGSEAFVNGPSVPIPGAVWLIGSALLATGVFGRKRRSSSVVAA